MSNMNTKTNVALLIPATSKGQDWTKARDSWLYQYTLKTFIDTLHPNDTNKYYFFVGYDSDDPFYGSKEVQLGFGKYNSRITFRFFQFDSSFDSGHLTKMWNHLYKIAYQSKMDYFYQCGDDILFKTSGWVLSAIDVLQKNEGYGVTGPWSNNASILTQCFVSRKHYETFQFFFPEKIKNWGCDDWINFVYSPKLFFPLKNHYVNNCGGKPRYEVNHYNLLKVKKRVFEIAKEHKIVYGL